MLQKYKRQKPTVALGNRKLYLGSPLAVELKVMNLWQITRQPLRRTSLAHHRNPHPHLGLLPAHLPQVIVRHLQKHLGILYTLHLLTGRRQSSAGVDDKRLLTCPRLVIDEVVAAVGAPYVVSGFPPRYVQWLEEEMVFAFTKLSVPDLETDWHETDEDAGRLEKSGQSRMKRGICVIAANYLRASGP